MDSRTAKRTLTIFILWTLLGIASQGTVYAIAAANLDQCANGSYGTPPPFCAAGSGSNDWQNGNLNANNSNYKLDDSVPFRDVMTGISGAGLTFRIQFQATHSGKNAYDYLTTWNRAVTGADPCKCVTGCVLASPSRTFPIPPDPSVKNCNLTGNQVPGVFTMWNGTITGVSGYGATGCFTGNTQQSITVTFTVLNSANPVVLAWGGHIASDLDWGANKNASAISGAPYHMFQGACSFGCGSQDRSIISGGVAQPPTGVTQISHTARAPLQVVSDTITLSDPANKTVPTGQVNFFICGPTASITPCNTGTQVGGVVTVTAISSTSSRGSSANTNPLANGVYCFRALSTNDGLSNFSNGVYTSTVGECVPVSSTTAVVLSNFRGSFSSSGALVLNWSTASEVAVAGFNLYRSENPNGPYARVNSQVIPASGDQLTGSRYV